MYTEEQLYEKLSNLFIENQADVKHVQAESRLNTFLLKWEISPATLINKKNEVLRQRFDRYKITGENQKTYSNSIEIKRQEIIRSVLENYNMREDFFDDKIK
ncbi:hypothetical protein [Xenorhabdus lircayensis]|uniref:Uncharacterized protein n=1 Tax=Xenorhabdus lircayensis TaxID=2763499 RepID=A0ABS0UC85_9GAMM|nr:hypothetical protein [Xenorhabdus lircayensis]MBI6550356.1 hypothetical protein [Xenorhabdus lircayensis]